MGLSEVGYLLAQALSGISGRPREGNGLEEAKIAWYNCDKCALGKENCGRRRVRALCGACLGECGRMRVYMMVAWNIQSAMEADLHEPTPQPVTPEAHRASQPTQPSFTLLVPIRTMQQYTFKFVIQYALPVQKSDPWREPADATERVPGKSPLQQRDTCDVSTFVRETLETAKQARNINADNKASVS